MLGAIQIACIKKNARRDARSCQSKHCIINHRSMYSNMGATLVVVIALPGQRSKALPPVLAVCCRWRVVIFLHVLSNHLQNCLFLEGNITEKRLVLLVQRNEKQCFIVSKSVSWFFFSGKSGRGVFESHRPPSWIFIRYILLILHLGAEWMEWRSVHSGIWMQNKRMRAFHILAILILEL